METIRQVIYSNNLLMIIIIMLNLNVQTLLQALNSKESVMQTKTSNHIFTKRKYYEFELL